MPERLSLGAKIKRIAGLVGTKDVNEREGRFIATVVARTNNGTDTRMLTESQVEWVEDIFDKHFA